MRDIKTLLNNNSAWVQSVTKGNANYFSDLVASRNLKYLWLGCIDSLVPELIVTNTGLGTIFSHRNVANIFSVHDASSLSVLELAIELEIKNIIVCGHYGCLGIQAAVTGSNNQNINIWVREVREIAKQNHVELAKLPPTEAHHLLCELNVKHQVQKIVNHDLLRSAWINGKDIFVHGLIYDVNTGKLRDLKVSCGKSPVTE